MLYYKTILPLWAGVMNNKLKTLSLFVSFFVISSCTLFVDVNKPLHLLWDKTGKKTENLIIFIPGLYDSQNKFKKELFFKSARDAGIKADLVSVNINVVHLAEKMLSERINKDVLDYVKNDGYKNIWLVGVSIGGMSSLVYLKNHEKDICGVVILAPYLGDEDMANEMKLAGGVKNWVPIVGKLKDSVDEELESLWLWLAKKNHLSNVYLGYGKQDDITVGSLTLKTLLEKKNVIAIDGEHDWETGRKLWIEQLRSRAETGLLAACN